MTKKEIFLIDDRKEGNLTELKNNHKSEKDVSFR